MNNYSIRFGYAFILHIYAKQSADENSPLGPPMGVPFEKIVINQ